jgi:hypothetical protein
MLALTAVSEILRVINNQNRASEAFLWLQEILRELQGLGHWEYHRKQQQCPIAAYLALPTDFDELISPVFVDSATTLVPGWQSVTTPWKVENFPKLTFQKGDIRIDATNLMFHPRWSTGAVLLTYYRKITIPATVTDAAALDLPDEFVYRLAVYGAARHGLLGEDDFERLQYAEAQYQQAISQLKAKDARLKIANERQLMGGEGYPETNMSPWPSNYSL